MGNPIPARRDPLCAKSVHHARQRSGRRIEIAPETRPDSIPGPKPPPLAPSSFMAIIRHCDECRVQGPDKCRSTIAYQRRSLGRKLARRVSGSLGSGRERGTKPWPGRPPITPVRLAEPVYSSQ
jgi:hypothetical protein